MKNMFAFFFLLSIFNYSLKAQSDTCNGRISLSGQAVYDRLTGNVVENNNVWQIVGNATTVTGKTYAYSVYYRDNMITITVNRYTITVNTLNNPDLMVLASPTRHELSINFNNDVGAFAKGSYFYFKDWTD